MTTLAAFAADTRAVARLYESQGFTREEAESMAVTAMFGALCDDRPDLAREITALYNQREG